MSPSLSSETRRFWRARVGDQNPDKYSVRPPATHNRYRGGPSVDVDGMGNSVGNHHEAAACAQAVFLMGEIDGSDELRGDYLLCSPCEDEEEQALVPGCLPDVYQPTHSEYFDYCVTHYPYRAWCKHCLEGRGREFGHEAHRGDKDARATPVISLRLRIPERLWRCC